METPEISKLAEKITEKANECCYRSDGWEENLAKEIESLLHTELRDIEFACAMKFDADYRSKVAELEKTHGEAMDVSSICSRHQNPCHICIAMAVCSAYTRAAEVALKDYKCPHVAEAILRLKEDR